MTDNELIDLLKERNALIVHCSRPGKGDVGADGLLFPEDLRNAIHICANENRELSCSLVWPEHVKTFGAIGIVLRPRSVASITSISPHDSGTHFDALGKREGGGALFSAEAVDETFANSVDYNEWTVTDADTTGIFVNLSEPLEVAKIFDLFSGPELRCRSDGASGSRRRWPHQPARRDGRLSGFAALRLSPGEHGGDLQRCQRLVHSAGRSRRSPQRHIVLGEA
jgi:hypothetical protein